MKSFSQLGIKPKTTALEGDKIKIDRILNRDIVIQKYEIKDSKFTDKGNGKCLHLQLLVGENKHVLFTGSTVLMDMIQQVRKEDLPIKTSIVKSEDHFQFT